MWTNEQKKAIDIRDKNILVSASAGSGKTAVLVERVIKKVIEDKVSVDKILVVTFTSAAASELKQKLINAINESIKQDKSNYFLKKQLDNSNKASITTIHSFCLEIIRENFYKLNLDPAFSICDDINSKLLKSQAMVSVIENEYKNFKENEFGIYNLLNLYNLKDEDLMQSLDRIFTYIQSFEYPFKFLEEKIENYNLDENVDLYNLSFGKEIYDDIIDNMTILVKRLEILREKSALDIDMLKITLLLDSYIDSMKICINRESKSFDKLYEDLNKIEFPRFPIVKVVDVDFKDEIKNFINSIVKEEVKSYKKSIYADTKTIVKGLKKTYPYLKYITELLNAYNNEYIKLKKEKNVIDFNDIEHFAIKVLIDDKYTPTEVANSYKQKFEEVYTDEYQDTSFIQEAILNAVSKNNNRFMVGDIKQSIYRFRQAMPEIFNHKYATFELSNEENTENINSKVILAKNFRSREKIIDSINYMFCKLMSLDLGDCDYSNDEVLGFGATRLETCNENNYNTEINIIDLKNSDQINENITGEELEYIEELKKYEVEAKYIATRIKDMVENKEFKVYDDKQKIFRNVMYKDIVILLRGLKNKSNILEETFKNSNIPCFSDTENNIFDNDEIRLVISLLKILDNPFQDIDMVAVMYSCIAKFTADEIYTIRELDKKEYIYNNMIKYAQDNETELSNKVNFLLDLIEQLTNYAKMYTVAELLNKIYLDTSIYLESFLINTSSQSKINLDSLVVVANKLENTSIYSYLNYVELLSQKQVSDNTTAKSIGENEDVVRIMTIHKSKGLEFPVVILSDTSSKYNAKDNSSIVTLNHNYGLGMNVIDEDYYITYPSIIKEAIKLKELKMSRSEELRVLYVALTRAKEKLIIYSTLNDLDKKINNMYISVQNNRIDSKCVYKNTSFSDNILMSMSNNILENKEKDLFDINIYNAKEKDNIEKIIKETKKDINLLQILQNNYNNQSKEVKEIIDKNINTIKGNIEREYKYKEDIALPTRVSVSKLKEENSKLHLIEKVDEESEIKKEKKYIKPKCLEETETYNAARKGTLIHFILEHLDFKNITTKKQIIEYINRLIMEKIIVEEEKKYINITKIYNFLNSDLGKKIRESSLIKREEEFVYKDEKYSKSVIQGVIDLYFKTKDNKYIIVDFKTDNITDKQQFIDKYKLQLDIYKDALININHYDIEKVYIYSFKLDTAIEI